MESKSTGELSFCLFSLAERQMGGNKKTRQQIAVALMDLFLLLNIAALFLWTFSGNGVK